MDLAAGYTTEGAGGSASKVYLNRHGMLDASDAWASAPPQVTTGDAVDDAPVAGDTYALAWGDANADGLPDLAAVGAAGVADQLYLNGGLGDAGSPTGSTRVCVGLDNRVLQGCGAPTTTATKAVRLATADAYALPGIRSENVISITYALTNTTGAPIRMVRASYSTDGGGSWRAALNDITGTDTITATASGGPLIPGGYTYPWSVLASGFLGQSDNVVFRLEAYPGLRPTPGSVANSYRSSYVATQTYPFRVRGSQVRVMEENGNAAAGALVYRLPQGQVSGARLSDRRAGRSRCGRMPTATCRDRGAFRRGTGSSRSSRSRIPARSTGTGQASLGRTRSRSTIQAPRPCSPG